MPDVFGRTNQQFARIWLKLQAPDNSDEIESLAEAALASKLPLDLSSSPALWGGKMRGTDAVLACASAVDFERATDAKHASDLVQAHLIETLSCIGREHWDFYFFRVRTTLSEALLSGALDALEGAKQEGHVRFIGLLAEGDGKAARAMWQLHDAFEVLLAPNAECLASLSPLARARRVAVVSPEEGADARLVTVTSAQQVRSIL